MKNMFTRTFSVTLLASVVALLSACNNDTKKPGYEYMPDMYRSPSYETNSPNPVFKNGMTSQKPVAGTIPVGYVHYPYPNTPEGYETASREWIMPATLNTPENLTEGKRLYEAYCSHCHGLTGQADGGVITRGFPPPPSYTTGKSSRGGDMKDLTDGKIYHTIQYGLNLMGSHASQLTVDERWRIIMYVHELQKAGQPAEATADSTGTKSEAPKSDKKM